MGCPASGGLPFFQTQGLWPSAQGAMTLPADLSVALAQPVPMGHHSFRLLLEENAFQALSEEPLLKRPHTECGALPGGEGSLLSLPFPIVNSHHFVSIWWEEDGTCIGISEELFENILERVGSDKVFETDLMKGFFRQLSLYGFSKECQDVLTSLCLTTLLTDEPPVCVLSKVRAGEYLLGPGGGVGPNLRAAGDGGRPAGKAVCKDRTGDWHDCQSCQCACCFGEL